MRRLAFLAVISHWRRHPLQLLTLVLGLALATGLWSGVQAINAEARASYDRAAAALDSDRPVIRATTGTIPEAAYVAMRRAGWPVSPVVDGWIDGGDGSVRLIGTDPLTAPDDSPGSDDGASDGAAFLDFITPPGQLIAAPETARRLTRPDLPPVTVAEDAAPAMAFADIGIAQGLLGLEGQVSRLIVTGDLRDGLGDPAAFHPGLELRAPTPGIGPGSLTDSFHLNLTAFGFLSFAVGLLIVHGAIGLAFEQRRAMFRTLRALGVPSRSLSLIAVTELGVVAIVAGALGMVIGYAVAAALISDVAATLRGLYGVPVEGSLALRPSWWVAGFAIALIGTAVAAGGTLWKIARLPVLAPARPRALALTDARLARAQAAGAVLLAVVAVIVALTGSGLVAGFALLGAMLLAAALALPLILAAVVRLAARMARDPVPEWFWADTRQQLPGLSLALMALLLALAANVGVGTMVSSFRLAFDEWLDRRLVSELYVEAMHDSEAERLQAWLAERVDAVLPIWHVDGEVMDGPGEIYGVIDHPTYRDTWPLIDALPDVWDRVMRGEGALVNEQLARREGLQPGDSLPLPGGWSIGIAGTYADYGNPAGQVVIGLDRLVERYPEVERLRFGVRTAPHRVPELSAALVNEFGLSPGQITDQASLKAFSRSIFERTFAVTAALNVLTLAIAGFAILTSLLTLSGMRLPQLAPAWALGLPRRTLAQLELLRTVALAGATFLLSLPLGLLLAWVLLTVINLEAFGWKLPLYLFPADWLHLGVLALVAAGAAALWPAIRLSRIAPATLLRVFAHER